MFGIDTRSPGYTRTSTDNFATKLSNWATYSPIQIPIPFFKSSFVMVMGTLGAGIDAIGWLVRGKPASALTALVAGGASTAVNASISDASNPVYWLNVASGLFTGRSLGTHARKVTEVGISAVTAPLGVQPTVLRSYPAVTAFRGGPPRNGFLEAEAGRRGQTVNQAWARVNSNQGDHVAALESANRGQSAQLG